MPTAGRFSHDPGTRLPQRVALGVLLRSFPPALVDDVLDEVGRREQRQRLLPARLMVYFTLAMWIFRALPYELILLRLSGESWSESEFGRGVGLEAGELPRVAHEHFAGLRERQRLGAREQYAPDPLLERLHPLAHRRRRDVESSGSGVESAFVDGGEQGADLVEGKFGQHGDDATRALAALMLGKNH